MTNQRKDPRLGLRLNITYKIAGTSKSGKSISHDMSAGGVRFLAEHPLDVGAKLEIFVRLPEGDQMIRCVGEVVWSRAGGAGDAMTGGTREVGVRFVEIAPKDQQLLKQYAMFYLPPESI